MLLRRFFGRTASKQYLRKPAGMKNPRSTPAMKELAIEKERQWTEANIIKKEQFNDQKSIARPEFLKPMEALTYMDTTMEGFFRKREINTENFNQMLMALNAKKDLPGSISALEKMKSLSVGVTAQTYDILLSTCAKAQNVDLALEVFNEGVDKFGKSVSLYNGLISVYSRSRQLDNCIKVMKEIEENGLTADLVCYTTLIQALKYAEKYDLCHKYFDELVKKKLTPDEVTITLMMQVCAHTHDAEKAMNYFKDNKPKSGFYRTCFPYNAYIKALASRPDYAVQAEAVFTQMINYQIEPDQDSITCVLKATGKTGNVKAAFNALQIMKERGIPINQYVYNGLLRTYAAACSLPTTSQAIIKEYKKDSWNLYKQADSKGMVTAHVLDSLMLVHSKSHDMDTVEGSILPIYETKGIALIDTTYEVLLNGYEETMELPKMVRIYERIKDDLVLFNSKSMNMMLHTFIRLKDTEKIEDMLVKFSDWKRYPKAVLLSSLGNSVNLPDTLYALLHRFDKKYGVVASKRYKVITKVKRVTPADPIRLIEKTTRKKMNKGAPGRFEGLLGRKK